jgi:hypothetical protein
MIHSNVRGIRPYQLFQLVKEPPSGRVASLMIPARRAAGGTTLLETMLLIAACRAVNARRVFEFGTFMGTNTFNLALNVPQDGEILTLDLPDESFVQHDADLPFAKAHLTTQVLDFEGSCVEGRIRRLRGNSRTFDFSPWRSAIDLAFIDGGHDAETVRSDTESALMMAARDKTSGIVWHDYGNADYPELTEYLNTLAKEHPVIHIEDTMLCVLLFNLSIC